MRKRYAITAALALLACGDTEGSENSSATPSATDGDEPTYHRDVRPLIETNCVSCHKQGGIGPFALEDWDEVESVKGLVVAAVESRSMPPWLASDDCREIEDAGTLSDDQREVFVAWREAEFPEGDEDDFEPIARTEKAEFGTEDLLFEPSEAYTPDKTVDDEYRCFLTDGVIEEDTYITAMEIRPGILEQVHHVQVHKITESQIPDVEALEEEADGPGYPCGGAGVQSVNMFSWRPGSQAVAFAPGDAMLIEEGSAIVLQVHYNNQFLEPDEEPEPDLSTVAFWTTPDGERPERVVMRSGHTGPVGPPTEENPFGMIPAGESEVVGESTSSLRALSTVNQQFVKGELIGVTPHMHTLGTRLAETFMPADGDSSCLVDIPEWDFEWQLDYAFRKPLEFGPDDSVRLICEYDNSPGNQPFLDGERIQPRDVTWGEGSLDEMCLNYLWFRYDWDDFIAARETEPTLPEEDPDCPHFIAEFADMEIDLPGCCSEAGVCGVISTRSSSCITESSFLTELAPGEPCGD
ncbi:MAG: hypothetical protein OXR73_01280 [Myxococcales bacterium]|nr:hypothetical protein [Myxococcales bacterium]